jgi:glutathione peroxidase-family protein
MAERPAERVQLHPELDRPPAGQPVRLPRQSPAAGQRRQQVRLHPQYAALEAALRKVQRPGLVIVGIPANNFMSQEPGTDAEIKTFCTNKYNVTFPMMSKVSVKGDDKAPLYTFLTDKSTDPKFAGDIKWNFTKFLFDRNGNPVARFEPATKPDSPEVIAAIDSLADRAIRSSSPTQPRYSRSPRAIHQARS